MNGLTQTKLVTVTASLLLMLATAFAAPAAANCELRAMRRAQIAGDHSLAMRINAECIEQLKQNSIAAPEQRWTHETAMMVHLAVRSQLAAEAGRLNEAEGLLVQVESYFSVNDSFLVDSQTILSLTRGYFLEMSGQWYEAEQFYLRSRGAHSLARLAVLAMHRGDDAQAIDWAAKAMAEDPQNLSARIVIAALSRTRSLDPITERLLREAVDGNGAGASSMPAYYAEAWWALHWLQETGRIGRPPSR